MWAYRYLYCSVISVYIHMPAHTQVLGINTDSYIHHIASSKTVHVTYYSKTQ